MDYAQVKPRSAAVWNVYGKLNGNYKLYAGESLGRMVFFFRCVGGRGKSFHLHGLKSWRPCSPTDFLSGLWFAGDERHFAPIYVTLEADTIA